MKIEIKNKNRFYNFLKENLKKYNKNIREYYLNNLIEEAKTELSDGLNSFEIPKLDAKNQNPLLYGYILENKIEEINGDFKITKTIIEL